MTADRSDQDERPGAGLRPEIQLLRAAAVLAVVVNHLWPGQLTGGYLGVDVFFVISGYLITAHLLRELDATGRIGLAGFWARRARRLLPAALLVLLVTAAATVALIPTTQWNDVMKEIVACALYAQNWVLAAESQDYFASTQSPSPVTHYWSLSVEEQFYLVWPLLAFGAYAAGRLLGRPRAAVAAVFAVVVVASLVCSIWWTGEEPTTAYYVTPARMWQLGAGGLLAFVPRLRGPRQFVALSGWTAVLVSLTLFDEVTAVPGWITLVPVLGTLAVIWAGDAFLTDVPAALRPAVATGVWVGGISYSLYLWHWPPIVLVPHATGAALDDSDLLLLAGAILLVAWLSTRFVEDPIRRARPLTTGPARRTFLPAVVGMLVVVVVARLATGWVDDRRDRVVEDLEAALDSGDPCFAARAMVNECESPHLLRYQDSSLLTVDAYRYDPEWGEVCMQKPDEAAVVECEFGVPAEEANLRVALVGDSHARHWMPALDELALEHGWNVVILAKPSCPVNAASVRTRNYPEYFPSCRAWNDAVTARVAGDETIDVVVTSANSRNYVVDGIPPAEDGPGARGALRAMEQGYREVWEQWTASGKKVVVIVDPPRMQVADVPTCVAEAGTDLDPCTAPRDRATRGDPLALATRRTSDPDIVSVDLLRFFCSDGVCHSVIGGIVAFSDTNHLESYFARSLAPYLYEQMRPAIG